MYWFLSVTDNLLLVVSVLINVAFITLMERKVLSYSQSRVGPNKPSFTGLLQPASDAVKLFSKNLVKPSSSLQYLFFVSPLIALFLVVWVWTVIPQSFEKSCYLYSSIFLLMILSLNVYPLLLSGWASTNKYSMIGALRSVAQTISYEVSLALVLLTMLLYTQALPMDGFYSNKDYVSLLLVTPSLGGFWLISSLAETNRTPFDFAEGESELVSGFNTEYSSGAFAVIFMAEYGSIYFLSLLSAFIFSPSSSFTLMVLLASLVVFFWVWARSTFPRYRYDLLMSLAWKSILPLILALAIFSVSVGLY